MLEGFRSLLVYSGCILASEYPFKGFHDYTTKCYFCRIFLDYLSSWWLTLNGRNYLPPRFLKLSSKAGYCTVIIILVFFIFNCSPFSLRAFTFITTTYNFPFSFHFKLLEKCCQHELLMFFSTVLKPSLSPFNQVSVFWLYVE